MFSLTVKPLFGKFTCNFDLQSWNNEDTAQCIVEKDGLHNKSKTSKIIVCFLAVQDQLPSTTHYVKESLLLQHDIYSIYHYNKTFYVFILNTHIHQLSTTHLICKNILFKHLILKTKNIDRIIWIWPVINLVCAVEKCEWKCLVPYKSTFFSKIIWRL